jgi:hypothetical protein
MVRPLDRRFLPAINRCINSSQARSEDLRKHRWNLELESASLTQATGLCTNHELESCLGNQNRKGTVDCLVCGTENASTHWTGWALLAFTIYNSFIAPVEVVNYDPQTRQSTVPLNY